MSNGFGAQFRAVPRAVLKAASTPPSGNSPEAIWHTVYDTQLYTSAATVRQVFFQTTNVDQTRSNMEASGQFPAPQIFQIYNITCDFIPITAGVSTAAAAVTGTLNDLTLLQAVSRATWTFSMANKAYGPYPLSFLHASGGLNAQLGGTTAAGGTIQYAGNTVVPGWNYFGRIIIPEQNNFSIVVNYAAAQTLTQNYDIRIAMSGVLSRRVL